MDIKKSFIMVCLMILIMMIIGGVSASEDIGSVSSSGDLNATLEVNDINEVDNLASDDGADSDNENGEILGASNDEEVLSDTSTDESLNPSTANLRNLIQNNPNNDIILTKDYNDATYGSGITVKNPSITGNLGNTGGMVTLSGSNDLNERIFFISSGVTTTISNIKFSDTRADEGTARWGGAIRVGADANVTFINCVFQHDAQCEAGGAVYFESGARGQFYNCTFYDDFLRHETHDDSAIGGTAVAFQSTTLAKFDNCTFRYNHCDSYCNGAIYIGAGSSNVEIDNCTFRDNNAKTGSTSANTRASHNNIKYGKGGAVYIADSVTNITITDSIFINNTANHYGGAIYVSTGCSVVTIENCTFENNSATFESSSTVYPAAQGGVIHYNVGQGGAVYFDGGCSNVSLVNSTFKNNYAPNYGGAIYFNGTINNLLINGSTFEDNTVKNHDGAAIYIPDGNTATVDNSTFRDNSAGGNGGAVYWGSESDFATTSSTFEGNTAKDGSTVYFAKPVKKITIVDTVYNGNVNTGTGSVGGALKIDLKEGEVETLEIINCTFIGNEVPTDGAAVYVPNTVRNVHVYNCSFEDNRARSGRGAAIFLDNDNELIIINTTFINNTARQGATVYFNKALNTIIINDTQFINNTATNDDGAGIKIPNGAGNVELSNCIFIGNNASGNGGGLYIPTTLSSLTITNITKYSDNSAGGYGGAIYWGITPDLDIDGYTFINNHAGYAGAIYYAYALTNKVFDNVTFINNTATNNGGALFIVEGSQGITFNDCNFTGNGATNGYGGALYFNDNSNDISIQDSTFDNNYAKSGGAIQFYANVNNLAGGYSNVDITNCNFTNNDATYYDGYGGSAITFNLITDLIIDKCKFDSNAAEANGALMFDYFSNVFIINTNFTNNNASSAPAAFLFNAFNNGNATFMKCIFENNTASGSGTVVKSGESLEMGHAGAVYLTGKDHLFIDCNFTNNHVTGESRDGGAIYANANNVTIINNRFTNNSANRYAGVLRVADNKNTFKITDSTFIENHAKSDSVIRADKVNNPYISDCTFEDNYATDGYGCLYLTGFDGVIDNCNFTDNRAKDGSAIAYVPLSTGTAGGSTKANITNCNFVGNNATGTGTVYFQSSQGRIENCNFDKNVANRAGGIYVNIDNVLIIKNNFTNNNATEDGGAIYLNSPATGTHIEECNFIENNARNGAAIVMAADNIVVTKSNFTNNIATGNGGAIYALASKSSLNVSDSIFKQNNAANGGAIYYGDSTAQSNGLTVYNDTFISNTAIYNGGAIDYLVDAANYWRDYNNFNNESLLDQTSNRYTWNHNGNEIIHTSYFDNNIDYAMSVAVSVQVPTAVITVTVPGRFDKATAKINITAVNQTGGVYHVIVDGSSIPSSDWVTVGDNIQITVRLNNQEESKYNTTVGVYDVNHNYKEDNVTYTISTVTEGRFQELQRLIDEAINNPGGAAIPVLELSEDFIYMPGMDHGPIHIDAPIIIRGVGNAPSRIDALNYCRIFEINSDNVTFDNILFANGNASGVDGGISTAYGGAILWNGLNGVVSNSVFNTNTAENGGAVFWNASKGTIDNVVFESNTAVNGGAVMISEVSDVKVLKSTFNLNANNAIYVITASDVLINDTIFNSNDDCVVEIAGSENINVSYSVFTSSNGYDVLIEGSENVLLYNLTVNDSQGDASVYVNGNITIDNVKISNYASSNAIVFNSGESSLSNSEISGNNPIKINAGATVNMTETKNIDNNGAYSVENNGNLYLNHNNFTNVIVNKGNITSKTTTKVLNNATVAINIGEDAILNVSIVDDNDNVISVPVKFKSNNNVLGDATYQDGYYYYTYANPAAGIYTISVNDGDFGLKMNDVENATLKVNDPNTSITLNITQENQGETVIIKAKVSPNGAIGNVTFIVNDLAHSYVLNETKNLDGEFVATLVLNNLTPNTYVVKATYNGDNDHYACTSNDEIFVVKKRDVNITINVEDIAQGDNATAIVTTNANGTVILSLNGRKEVVIENGQAILNYSDLDPGVYTIYVDYAGNDYYNSASNSTTFTVYKFDMDVNVSETQFNQSATITVTLPSDVAVMPKIYLDGNLLTVVNKTNGVFEAVTDNLAVGTYEVNVTFEGDAKYYARDINGTKLVVSKDDSYPFDVEVTPAPYGEDTVINVTGPAGTNVTVTVDGVNYTVTVGDDGKGNLTLNNLTAGPHHIVANFTGDENHTGKSVVKDITIPKQTPDIQVIVPENITPGSPANVTVVVGENATGTVIVTVDGVPTEVNVTNGTAVVPVPTDVPGDHNITVKYFGDDNYDNPGTVTKANYTVDKYDAEIDIKEPIVNPDNSVVVVVEMVPSDATGNVTVTLANGTNFTVALVDGKAEIPVGVLPVNSTMAYNVTYSGDDKYNKTTKESAENLTVGRLNNFDVNVTINEGQAGENTTVIVAVTPGVDGDVSVVVDNVSYPVTQDVSGNYVAVIPPLPVGDHNVTVKFENSSNYEDREVNKNYTVEKNDHYPFDVEVTPAPYGEDTVINVTGPAGTNVTVTVDGVNYTVTVGDDGKGNLTLDNLTAGPHHIVANFTGDENHTGKEVVKDITIPKQTPDIQVIVPENITPNSPANVTVVVGENATGTVIVTIDGVPTEVNVTNGTAVVPIPTDVPGDHNITVKYFGDDNYNNPGTVTKANYTVDKYDAEIDIKEPIVNPDNSVVVVVEMVPSDATGNVTVTLANGTNFTVALVDGKAEIPVGVLPVNSTMAYNVTYSGDDKYNKTTKESAENLTVGRLSNFDVNVTINEGQAGENTTVIVAVTPGVDGDVSVVVDNVSYPVTQDASGNYVAVIPPLPVGDHNVTVKFENSSNYADKEVNKNYTVEKNDHYPFDVEVTPAPYGEDTVINVTGPAGTNVTVTVDGVNYTVTVGDDGKGNLTLDNLTAGPHHIVANFTGDENHTGKEVVKDITVPKQTPDIQVIVPDDIAPNSPANVTVVVGDNATGKVIVTIDGVPTMVEVTNGTAVVPIPTDKPGAHNITVQFSGDDNYAAPANVTKANYTVDKYDAEIDIKEPIVNPDNSVVVVVEMVPSDATGNVTVTLANGTNFTVALVDGKAEIPVGVLPVNSTMAYNVTYSGDDKYNKTTKESAENLTVGRLSNFDVNVTINEGKYGENTTVIVAVTPGVDGDVSVVVDNVSYPVTQDASGNYVAIIPPLDIGSHNVTVKFENSSNYADREVNKTFSVDKNDHYPFDVEVTPAPYGGDTVINVTGPAGTNVTVTVDDVNYTVTIGDDGKGNLTLNNLSAGPHEVVVNFTGDENHTGKTVSEKFDVPKQTPDIQVIVPDDIAPNSPANVTVVVGDNATGKVIVTIDGVPTMVEVTNGTAVVPIPTDNPGAHNITVQFSGDDNYAAPANVTKANYTVDKFNPDIIIKDPIVNPDNSVVVVVEMVPSDATGNVTVTLANGTEVTVALVDGKAEIPVGVLPVNSTMAYNVTYSGDDKYNKTTKESAENLTVGRLSNFDVNVTINEGQAGENTTVIVAVTPGVDGDVSVVVDNVSYPVTKDASGNYVAVIPPLPVGDHNVTVKFENSSNYEDREVNKNYTVVKNDHYPFDVEVTPAPYGGDTVINVTGPAGTNVTVTVDGVNYTVTVGDDGKGNLTLNNLSAGPHEVVVNFTGDENHTGKTVSEKFDVPKQTPDIQVIVPDDIAPNSPANVTVVVGDNATGTVIVTIDGVPTEVNVTNGTAVVPIPTDVPGDHNITVKYFGDDNYATPGTVTKANYTVDKYDAEIDIKEPIVNPDNSVVVVVEMVPSDATGNVTVTLANGTNFTVALVDGKAEIPVGVLPVNSTMAYNVTYSGDDKYNKTTKSAAENLTVGRLSNFDVNVTINEGQAGENTTVIVAVTPGVGGNVSVVVDNVSYPVTQDASGNYVAVIPPLPVGDHNVTVKFENSSNYEDKEVNKNYTIEKNDHYPFDVEVTPAPYGGDTVINVTGPAGTNVTVTVDDVNYTVTIGDDGKGNLTLNNLSAGPHDVVVNFTGDENHTGKTVSERFSVPKQTPEIQVNVTPGAPIAPGSDVNVTVSIGNNATGTVIVTVDGVSTPVEVKNGTAVLPISSAQPGTHNITVQYVGDDNYAAPTDVTKANFTVETYEPTVEVIGVERDDNNNVTVSVKVNGTGNVTVKVGDKTYNATVVDGVAVVNIGDVPVGPQDINITYSGDENFGEKTITEHIDAPVLKNYNLTIDKNDIKYGEVAQVNVTIPDDADPSNVKVYVDGELVDSSDLTVTGNVVQLNKEGLNAGNHTVEVVYEGDGKYGRLSNSTQINVAKADLVDPEINITSPVDVGQPVEITVKLPSDANGTITVNVNGTKYTYDLVNGSVNISIPNLGNGTYDINVTYSGDDNYDPVTVSEKVTVDKVVPAVIANTSDITVGQNAVIEVTLPDDATGNVTIKIGDIEQTTQVHGGVNQISVSGVPVGENKEVLVTYNGDSKYTPNTNRTSLTVNPKPTSPDDVKIIDNGDGTITVIVPDNATGNITVKIGNETLPAVNLTDGKAVINLTNSSAKPGSHNITVTYSGDENHTSVEVNSTGSIPKWDSGVNATAAKIREGDNATIIVEVAPNNATGRVFVEVNGTQYVANIENGKAVINAPGLKQGTHDIKVTYEGDDYYNGNSNTTQIVVEKPITVEVNGTGADAQVIIDLPDNATENVTAYIDGNEVPVVFDQNGTPTVNLSDVKPGEHNITIVYVDQNNNTSIVTKKIVVPKWPSTINATAPVIREGDMLPVTITGGSAEMDGLVLVDINGTGYYANLTGGKAVIYVPGLKEGVYDANVTYLGDEKYDLTNNTFVATVEAPLKISVEGAGNSTQVIVDLPVNGTENVTVLVDGKEVPVSVQDGKAVANLTGLPVGDHNVTVIYTDKYGTQSVVNTTIRIFNSIKANDMTRGWNSPYDYEAEFLDKDGHVVANTVMQFKVNGKTYKVKTDNKGIAKLTTSKLPVGKYKVEITNTLTNEKMTKTVTIVKRLINNKDITMDFVDGTYYKVTAIGDNGKPVGKGEVVGIHVNGRDYVAITDAKGVAKLKISLNPKTYTITASYAKYKVSNKLVVKQTLKLVKKTIKVKKSAKSFKIKATLKWSNGKAIKGKKIVFKLKGKQFTAKTNSKGVAQVTIKKSVIKKLKAGKTYKFSAKYITNYVYGKVKVSK